MENLICNFQLMGEVFSPRKHASLKDILKKAMEGDAFFVNRATLNGDLSNLPQNLQRLIVAVANDGAARHANDQIIPLTDEGWEGNREFIDRHLNLALEVFFKEDDLEQLKEQLERFYLEND